MQRVFGFEIYAASIVRPVLFIWQNGIEKSHICFRLIYIPHAHAKIDEKWQKKLPDEARSLFLFLSSPNIRCSLLLSDRQTYFICLSRKCKDVKGYLQSFNYFNAALKALKNLVLFSNSETLHKPSIITFTTDVLKYF